jgi:hypothetical protein
MVFSKTQGTHLLPVDTKVVLLFDLLAKTVEGLHLTVETRGHIPNPVRARVAQ